MKKIISLLTAAIMIASMLPVFAVETADASYGEEVGLLQALGIFDENISQGEAVTRGGFAVYAAKILGINTDEFVNKRYFKDVPSSRRDAGAINAMNERGLMIGTGNYEFAPDEPIEAEHIAIILLKIAGYPQVYIDNNRAPKREIMSGAEGNTVDDIQLGSMIYNALNLPYFTLTGIMDGEGEYDVDEDYLVLEELFGVYCISGRITAAEGASINGYGTASYDTVIIGDRIFRNIDVPAYDYLGMYVNAYIRNTEEEGMDTLVFLWDDSYDVIEIKADDVVSVTGNYEIQYTENGSDKIKRVTLPSNVRVIRNGSLVKEDVLNVLDVDNGSMKIIKNDKGAYDVVTVADFKTALVTAVDAEAKYIYTKNTPLIDLSGVNLQRVKVYDGNDKEMKIEDIKPGKFISYFESDVNIEIYISDKTISGKVEALSEGDVPKVKISGTESTVNPAYYNVNKDKFTVGREGNFYVDYDGRIAYAEGKGGEGSYAYALGVSITDFSKVLKLRVFDQSGAVMVLESDGGKIEIDGAKADSEEVYKKLIREGKVINQPVRYRLDSEGKLCMIDTPVYNSESESEYSLKKVVESQKLIYMSSSKTLGVKLPIGASTVVMQIPSEAGIISDNEKDYTLNPTFIGYDEYTAEGYSANPDSIFPGIIICGAVTKEESRGCVFDSVSEAMTSDGDVVKAIKLGGENGIETVNIADDFTVSDSDRVDGYVSWEDLGEGDLIKIIQNGRGEIIKIRLAFDYDKDASINSDRLNAYGHYETYDSESFGFVKKIEDGYYKYGPLGDDTKDEILKLSTSSIIVFDSSRRTDKVYIGSEKDITTVESVGANASIILTNQRSGLSQHTIVYKNGADAFRTK